MRRHLTYANAVATFALLFAMSGGALAAKHYLINSTSQINPKVLKKLKGNAGRIGAAGRTGATGPVGPAGATGNEGPQGKGGAPGTNGASNVVVRTAEVTVETGKSGAVTSSCEPGERATGGGVETGTGSFKNVSSPIPGGKPVPAEAGVTPTGWRGVWLNESGVTDTFHVYAVCASP